VKEKLRMGVIWKNWRVWAAVGVLLIACEPAHAFYWQGWPGSLLRANPLPVGPPSQPPADTAEPPSEEHTPPPPVGPPVPVDRPPVGPPTHTPEPATGLLGLLGLGAIAARRWWKRKC
jgi:MYXO-CTERM domain-containing protein